MADGVDTHVIAERVIPAKHQPTGRDVEVTLRCYAPTADCDRATSCTYEVVIESKVVARMAIAGVDGFQAMMLSMKSLAREAASIMRSAEITWPPEYTRDLEALGDALRNAMKRNGTSP